ncbi:hypothetical protein EDD86DRAFT_199398 [Gorgonomyces haynaldii]|nr:hypothetical protein EDD86DRAFT_199398 [Gorgonomyces haynaldii]
MNRDYPPIKAKQLNVMTIAVFSCFCWWIGDTISLGTFESFGSVIYCPLWVVIFQVVFGIQLYLTVFTFRLLRLYFILVRTKSPEGLLFWSVIALSFVPSFVMGLIPIFMPGKLISVNPVPAGITLSCEVTSFPYYVALFLPIFIQISFIGFLNFKVAFIRRSFNEFQETKISFIISVLVVIVGFFLRMYKYQDTIPGKLALSFGELIAAMSLFWATMYKPLYGLLFNKEGHLKEWQRGLKDEKLPSDLRYSEHEEYRLSVLPFHSHQKSIF